MLFDKKIIFLLVFITSCVNKEDVGVTHSSASLSLEEVTTWEINSPDIIPNPYYTGVLADGKLKVVVNGETRPT